MTALDKLRALHTLLWHARDEAGNKRLKKQLTDAIDIVEGLIKGSEAANKVVQLWTEGKVDLDDGPSAKGKTR